MVVNKIRGIVIKENLSGDFDKYVLIYAKNIGKISVFTRGARKINSKFLAGATLFTYGDFFVKEKNGKYYMEDIDIIENFYKLRNNLFTLSYGTFFLEIIDKSIPNEISENNILLLLLKSLQKLTKFEKIKLVSATFVIKLIALLGYFPGLENCILCNDTKTRYLIGEGLICEKCLRKDVPYIKISKPTIEAMLYINSSTIDKIFNFELTSAYVDELEDIGYFLYFINIGKEIKSFKFLKKIIDK